MTLIYTAGRVTSILIASVKTEKEVRFLEKQCHHFSLFDCYLKLDIQSQFPDAFPWT